jgi:hypothetical protein
MKVTYDSGIVGELKNNCKKILTVVSAGILIGSSLGSLMPQGVAAATLTQRSLHVADPTPSVSTRHTFTFSYATTSTAIGSLVFEYCTSPLPMLQCDTPPGLDASIASLAGQTGETGYTPFTIQQGSIVLARAPASMPASAPAQYIFDNVSNPNGVDATFYVRITTHSSTDGSGPPIDFGAVVSSTTQGVGLSTEVPPILSFCVGVSITGDCSTAEGNFIDLGELSPEITATGTSQMTVGTNAALGVTIAAYGTTMTSGNNTIPALANPTVSAPGNAQFGLNLRSNSNPPAGQEPSGIGVANPSARYGAPNQFAFVSGDVIATSPDTTDIRKFTVSYIVNVPPSQMPGVYTATLTYICMASF